MINTTHSHACVSQSHACDIKPCPFCGGEAEIVRIPFAVMTPETIGLYEQRRRVGATVDSIETNWFFPQFVGCKTCGIRTEEDKDIKVIIAAWNRRVGDGRCS